MDRIKQGQSFFMKLEVNNEDDTMDSGAEENEICETLDVAIQNAKESVSECGMTTYIYECRPVRKITQGKITVTPMGPKSKAAPRKK